MRQTRRTRRYAWPALAASLALLQACGGGGGGGDDGGGTAQTVALSGVVADGPLQGATVCYDLDDNGACDAGEPTSDSTDVNGQYQLQVPAGEAGKHAVIAQVPATAVDQDDGQPVGVALTLKAPASGSSTVFISPLTTLVQDIVEDDPEQDVAAAAALVQEQLGLAASPLANFVASGDAESAQLAKVVFTVSKAITLVAQDAELDAEQTRALVSVTLHNHLTQLPVLADAATGSTAAAVAAEVSQAVLEQQQLTADTAAAQADAAVKTEQAQPDEPSTAPLPSVTLRSFFYANAENYDYRVFDSSDGATDADGVRYVHEIRHSVRNGQAIPFQRNQAYWDGSQWYACPSNGYHVIAATNSTASGSTSAYCRGYKDSSKSSAVDIGGRKMADVVREIRAYPFMDGLTSYANWGPQPELLGEAVFPQGAQLAYRQVTRIASPDAIALADKVRVPPAGGAAPAFSDWMFAASLEQMISRYPADFGGAAVSGRTTLQVANYFLPTASPGFTTEVRLRVGFDAAGSKARFFTCKVEASTGNTAGCEPLLDTTYTVAEQGDAKVLRFAAQPSEIPAKRGIYRQFVERDGTVFYGFRDAVGVSYQQRLNDVAWAALREQLGIPAHSLPSAPPALQPDVVLRRLQYTDANNYFVRLLSTDDVTRSDGYKVMSEQRIQLLNGTQVVPARRWFWTGTEWYDCPQTGETVRFKAEPVRESIYCKALVENASAPVRVGIAGRTLADIVREIQLYPGRDGSFAYVGWGPSVSAFPALATTVFPPGSTLSYHTNWVVAKADGYDTLEPNRLRVPPADAATVPFNNWPYAENLAQVSGAYRGDFDGAGVSGLNTQGVYSYNLATPPAPEYTTQIRIRVAFDSSTQRARFYRCNQSASTLSTVNCSAQLLETTYSIDTRGDAQVLRFAAQPAELTNASFIRIFVARGGAAYLGSNDTSERRHSVRLNGVAWEALRGVLGIPDPS
ncbi:hypothetical protein OOT46_11700 [Aquabacterium sp. A7-Y]|uniref:hypothetical protein n=1 Tax=Aquabacterium sp. A7-Y TaxID=1349605 RepID=UPI00223D9F2C|nr:hypothetical protein [Aquabacterium sp. A7-Y]MCW7538505.1 hypothetical protein [Aquabacterium sp. A7-Y]